MSGIESIKRDQEFCEEHRELADILVEHGCAPAGEDRGLLKALVEYEARVAEDWFREGYASGQVG